MPAKDELIHYINIAIQIMQKPIPGSNKYIYVINSKDDGEILNYSASEISNRPKKHLY